jgi:hypothetical protein
MANLEAALTQQSMQLSCGTWVEVVRALIAAAQQRSHCFTRTDIQYKPKDPAGNGISYWNGEAADASFPVGWIQCTQDLLRIGSAPVVCVNVDYFPRALVIEVI